MKMCNVVELLNYNLWHRLLQQFSHAQSIKKIIKNYCIPNNNIGNIVISESNVGWSIA